MENDRIPLTALNGADQIIAAVLQRSENNPTLPVATMGRLHSGI